MIPLTRTAVRLTIGLAAPIIIACGPEPRASSVADTSVASLAGPYRLVSINGRTLPQEHHIGHPGCESVITTGWLTLDSSGRWDSRDTVVQTCTDTSGGVPPRHIRQDGLGGGGVLRRGDTLRFFDANSPPGERRHATVRRNTLYLGADSTWLSWADTVFHEAFRATGVPRVYLRVLP